MAFKKGFLVIKMLPKEAFLIAFNVIVQIGHDIEIIRMNQGGYIMNKQAIKVRRVFTQKHSLEELLKEIILSKLKASLAKK